LALWHELAERRNNAPSDLAEAAKQLDMPAWPAPAVALSLQGSALRRDSH